MRSLLIALLIACGGSQPAPAPVAAPPPPPPDAAPVSAAGDQAVAKLSELTDAMCKCTTKACAQQVGDDLAKWSQARSPDEQMTEAQTARTTELSQRFGDCMQKATK